MFSHMCNRSHYRILLVLLALAGWFSHGNLLASPQDDPFGVDLPGAEPAMNRTGPAVPATGAGARPAAADAPNSELSELKLADSPATKAVLESLRHSNPATDAELCAALRTVMDLGIESDSHYYLRQLMALGLDPSAMAGMLDREGSDFFLRIHGSSLLEPAGKEFAKAVFAASRQRNVDPAFLTGLIDSLAEPALEVRSAAFQKLRRIGPPAAAALINSFAGQTDTERVLKMRSALRNFGPESMQPLLAGIASENLQVRYECLTALARIREPDAMHAAAGAAVSPRQPDEIRQSVMEVLRETWGPDLDMSGLNQRIYRRALELLGGSASLPLPPGTADDRSTMPCWIWDPAAGSLVEKQLAPATLARLVALDRARELVAVAPDDAAYRRLHLLAWLDSAKRLTGPMQLLSIDEARAELRSLAPPELDETVRIAVGESLYPAAAGACDLLGLLPESADLLYGNDQAGLIYGLRSGDRHLQYCALRALRSLAPREGFHGSSHVLEMLVMLAGYSEQPEVFVAHPDPVLGRNIAVTLASSGFIGQSTVSGRELYQHAVGNANIRMLLIADSIAGPDCSTLLQQLRVDWRTRLVPVGILTVGDENVRAMRIAGTDPLTTVLPYTIDPALLQAHLKQLGEVSREWKLDDSQALEQGQWALDWMEEISLEREKYRWMDLVPYQQSLIGLLRHDRFVPATCRILSRLGTSDCQRALADFASQVGTPLELRKAAAEAFGQSARQHGVLLTTTEIRRQYDLYNASESDSVESQQVFGALLDQIEFRVRKAAESEASGAAPVVPGGDGQGSSTPR